MSKSKREMRKIKKRLRKEWVDKVKINEMAYASQGQNVKGSKKINAIILGILLTVVLIILIFLGIYCIDGARIISDNTACESPQCDIYTRTCKQ